MSPATVEEINAQSNSTEGLSDKTQSCVDTWLEKVRGGFGSFPIPAAEVAQVALDSADGHILTDIDGKPYIDMLSQFAVMNFGYSHPKIVEAVVEQTRKLPLVNTGWLSPLYTKFAKRLTEKFSYDSMTTMCTGADAVDAAIKIARKWAYVKKGVQPDQAYIVTADRCYHGITLATMPLSNIQAENYGKHLPHVGPYAPGSGKLIVYGELDVLEEALKVSGHEIAAFLIEPVQGSAGTRTPPKGYLKSVQDLCQKYNVLFICDEVQTGYGRTGTDLAYQSEAGVQPDLVTLGKAVTGGFYPMSVVMGKHWVMDVLSKNEVASTFAASPIACAAALASLDVLEEEAIAARSRQLGELLTRTIEELKLPYLLELRGRGLFQTLVIDETLDGVTARRIAALSALRGVLVGCGANRLRLSPPLTISESDLIKAVKTIATAFDDVTKYGDFPGSDYLN